MQLDSGQARNLGSLIQDMGIYQVFMREPWPFSLWEQLLTSVRERIVLRNRMQDRRRRMPWKAIEEGIQHLREVAVPEELFGRDRQHGND